MRRILAIIVCALLSIGVMVPVGSVSAAPASTQKECEESGYFLGFKPWYAGQVEYKNGKCEVKSPDMSKDDSGLARFIGAVAMNVLHDVSLAVLYASIGFLIYGGFRYATAAGSPEGVGKAKKTIQNAIIGLIISLLATVIVNVIFGVLNING